MVTDFLKIQECRKQMKASYGFHVSEEFHTKHLITDKKPFSQYDWTDDQRRQILIDFACCIADLDIQIINVIIDKTKIDRKVPVYFLIEDILEKDSKESYFVQVCDCVSYMVHLFYKTQHKKQTLPNRVGRVIDETFVCRFMATIQPRINLKASYNNYGLVIYPK